MTLFASLLALCLAAIVPEPSSVVAAAETTDSPEVPYSGHFRFAGGKSQREGVAEAIERSVEALLPLFHSLARKRLEAANSVPSAVTMKMDGNDLVVTYGDLPPQRAPLDGSVRHWHNREGTKVKLTHELRGGQLVQTTWGGGGGRVVVWSIDEAGKHLRMRSKMWSPQLPVPIEYRLTFAR